MINLKFFVKDEITLNLVLYGVDEYTDILLDHYGHQAVFIIFSNSTSAYHGELSGLRPY